MNIVRISLTLLVLVSVCVSCGNQSTSSKTNPSPQTQSSVLLFEDLGTHHHQVTASNAMAQSYFDQGLRLIFGFNHDEAERAFREAARLDPNCAMAWWGVAYALGPNYNLPMNAEQNARALEAVARAQAVQSGLSDSERDYIAAISTRYSSDTKADRAVLDRNYGDAMKELHERYPEDNDAAVLYAESLMDLKPWQLWSRDGKPAEGTETIVKLLESVLARDPNHPGANHYYIHAIEASPDPEKGLASAERLKSLMPGAGHLVHMPAHIYIRTGNYQGAIDANANAARADEAYFARTKMEGVYPLMYYTHNFQFLSAAAATLGQSAKAMEAAEKAVKNVAPMAGHDPMVEYVLPWSLYALVRCEKWDDILAYPRPADTTPATLAFWHYANALAHLGKGNLELTRKSRTEFESTRASVPKNQMLNTNPAHDLLAIASSVLEGRLASASGDTKSALSLFRKAVGIQDQLVYDEPPAWYYPVRESLGGELLRVKQYAEAERVFRRDLEINPNNPRSLFGVSEALRGQSKIVEADEFLRRFETEWKGADVQVRVATL